MKLVVTLEEIESIVTRALLEKGLPIDPNAKPKWQYSGRYEDVEVAGLGFTVSPLY